MRLIARLVEFQLDWADKQVHLLRIHSFKFLFWWKSFLFFLNFWFKSNFFDIFQIAISNRVGCVRSPICATLLLRASCLPTAENEQQALLDNAFSMLHSDRCSRASHPAWSSTWMKPLKEGLNVCWMSEQFWAISNTSPSDYLINIIFPMPPKCSSSGSRQLCDAAGLCSNC